MRSRNSIGDKIRTQNQLWQSLGDGSDKKRKRKGAMIIYNDEEKYKNMNLDVGLQLSLRMKGY